MIASTIAAFIDDDFGFVQIEVDRTAAAPRVVEDLEQLAHQLEHRHERLVALEQLGIAVGQDAVDARCRSSARCC